MSIVFVGAGTAKADAATMKDQEFLADARRSTIDIDPIGGKAMEELVARICATPAAVVDRVKAIYASGSATK